MPSARDFLQGFGIVEGMQIGPYVLRNIDIQHVPIVQYREYVYPMKLLFVARKKVFNQYSNQYSNQQQNQQFDQGLNRQPNADVLLKMLQSMVQDSKVIRSHYGNPYRCEIVNLSMKPTRTLDFPYAVVIEAQGKATRMFGHSGHSGNSRNSE